MKSISLALLVLIGLMGFEAKPMSDCNLEHQVITKIMDGFKKQGFNDLYVNPTFSLHVRGLDHYIGKYGLEVSKPSEKKVLQSTDNESFTIISNSDFKLKPSPWKKTDHEYNYFHFSPLLIKGDEYFIYYDCSNSGLEQIRELYSFKLEENCEIVDLRVVDGFFKHYCPK